MQVTNLNDAEPRPRQIAVGEFDGVHLGHRAVIGSSDTVLTFEPHPLRVVRPEAAPKLLTTLDPAAQQVARAALDGHRGAVVALDPRNGAVKVMASTPGYDPNALRTSAGARRLEAESKGSSPSKSFVNRATQFGYAPGSTFKIVTAAAAMQQSGVTEDTVLECPGSAQIGVRTIKNANFEKPPLPLHSALLRTHFWDIPVEDNAALILGAGAQRSAPSIDMWSDGG